MKLIRRAMWALLAGLSLAAQAGGRQAPERIVPDRAEAKKAFAVLNQIRGNPAAYCAKLRYCADMKQLRVPRPVLVWNDTLARVAEARAHDMAARNYFGHVDPGGYGVNHYIRKSGYRLEAEWTNDRRSNTFESIAAGLDSGAAVISYLIMDEEEPSRGHRKHLLGLDKWYFQMTDGGIGFVRVRAGSTYKTYVSILLARHRW